MTCSHRTDWTARIGVLAVTLGAAFTQAPGAVAEVGQGCGDELVVSRGGSEPGERVTLYRIDPEGHAVHLAAEESRVGGGARVAFGDVDGDGLDEVGRLRTGGGNPRWRVLRAVRGETRLEPVASGGHWGQGHGGTAVAMGDVDGDGRDELAVGRHGPSMRFGVYGFERQGGEWVPVAIEESGGNWGRGLFPTALAFGDMDGDGREELAVGRSGGPDGRVLLYRFAGSGRDLEEVDRERTWGPGKRVTDLAFGDVDGDGRLELAVGRDADPGEPRVLLYRLRRDRLVAVGSFGEDWGPGFRATALAFGDGDGDGRDEIAVARNGDEGRERLFLLRWGGGGLERLDAAAGDWGDGRYPVALAFGDVDADGQDELAVARRGLGRAHFGVVRLVGGGAALRFGAPVMSGADWASEDQALSLAFRGRRRDLDGDGLLDVWERRGIDGDCDGRVDLVLPGADPLRKDLYVEIDFMAGHRPLPRVEDDARAMFDLAPVENPGPADGVALHLEIDEEIPHHDEVVLWHQIAFGAQGVSFADLKARRFGTERQRRMARSDAVLAAKRLAYRYSLWIHSIAGSGASGEAELGGNDFVVSLGGFPSPVLGAHPAGGRRQQSGTFVHELGHTLGLEHGGGDEIDCKPNYLSVMSTTFQHRWIPNPAFPWGRLDYSRQALRTLVENRLDEVAGIGGGTDRTIWGSDPPGGQRLDFRHTGAADGPLDWDADGSLERAVAVDVNDLHEEGCGNSPGQVLVGHDDWADLDYGFRDSEHFAEGAHPPPGSGPPEPTPATSRRLALCPAGTRCGRGDWQRWCTAPPAGQQARVVLGCLRQTGSFADVDSLGEACRRLSQTTGDCGEARFELLRMALDLCTGLAAACCPVGEPEPEPLADVFDRLDRTFSDRVRAIGECRAIVEAAREAR